MGSSLSLPPSDLEGLRGFGTVLASGVDVDANTYNGILLIIPRSTYVHNMYLGG